MPPPQRPHLLRIAVEAAEQREDRFAQGLGVQPLPAPCPGPDLSDQTDGPLKLNDFLVICIAGIRNNLGDRLLVSQGKQEPVQAEPLQKGL